MNKIFSYSISFVFIFCYISCRENLTQKKNIEGMVWIKPGSFLQGARPDDKIAMSHEKPAHVVSLDGFYIDIKEVTNSQFTAFVNATNYVTLAERPIVWEEMQIQLPPGTPKPADSILQAGALTFKAAPTKLPNLYDFSQWWNWTIGADWRHPQGPTSNIEGKEDYPVVQLAYEDALAYCEWAGRSLPTEAQWEFAARGGQETIYTWGEDLELLSLHANSWEGSFPDTNLAADGFVGLAPTGSYPANLNGLYDMSGNVWEWTQDWYDTRYYVELTSRNGIVKNPLGPDSTYNPNNPYGFEKVIRGGSFLCNAAYCASYRVSARMASSIDTSSEHIGFRTVLNIH